MESLKVELDRSRPEGKEADETRLGPRIRGRRADSTTGRQKLRKMVIECSL